MIILEIWRSGSLLYAEAKLGELIKNSTVVSRETTGKFSKTLPPGVSYRLSHQAQTIAANMPKVERGELQGERAM